MRIDLFKILNNKKLLIFIALLSSYSFWSTIRHSQIGKLMLTVPVHIYNNNGKKHIFSPKTVDIYMFGPRVALTSINRNTLAVFIDAETLSLGTNTIVIHKNYLLLPNTIELEKKNIPTLTITTESIAS